MHAEQQGPGHRCAQAVPQELEQGGQAQRAEFYFGHPLGAWDGARDIGGATSPSRQRRHRDGAQAAHSESHRQQTGWVEVLHVVQRHENRGGGRQGFEHSEKGSAHGPLVEHLVTAGLQGYQAKCPGQWRGQGFNNLFGHGAHEIRQPDPRQSRLGRSGSRNQHVAALGLRPADGPFPNCGLPDPRLAG
jgi:hypothetical protein